MRIGIPIWNGRVSPVLDTAERLMVVEAGPGGAERAEEVVLAARPLALRAAAIADLDLDVLVCGAVSEPLSQLLESSGVALSPWVAGEIEEVLSALGRGELDQPRFTMPGCCRGRRRRRQQKRMRGGRRSGREGS